MSRDWTNGEGNGKVGYDFISKPKSTCYLKHGFHYPRFFFSSYLPVSLNQTWLYLRFFVCLFFVLVFVVLEPEPGHWAHWANTLWMSSTCFPRADYSKVALYKLSSPAAHRPLHTLKLFICAIQSGSCYPHVASRPLKYSQAAEKWNILVNYNLNSPLGLAVTILNSTTTDPLSWLITKDGEGMSNFGTMWIWCIKSADPHDTGKNICITRIYYGRMKHKWSWSEGMGKLSGQ